MTYPQKIYQPEKNGDFFRGIDRRSRHFHTLVVNGLLPRYDKNTFNVKIGVPNHPAFL
jgi:hypothetical protein